MQSLLIGYWKPIRGKGLSKNRPTCENAVSQWLYGSCTLRIMGPCRDVIMNHMRLIWKSARFQVHLLRSQLTKQYYMEYWIFYGFEISTKLRKLSPVFICKDWFKFKPCLVSFSWLWSVSVGYLKDFSFNDVTQSTGRVRQTVKTKSYGKTKNGKSLRIIYIHGALCKMLGKS